MTLCIFQNKYLEEKQWTHVHIKVLHNLSKCTVLFIYNWLLRIEIFSWRAQSSLHFNIFCDIISVICKNYLYNKTLKKLNEIKTIFNYCFCSYPISNQCQKTLKKLFFFGEMSIISRNVILTTNKLLECELVLYFY